ncbi:hypothetical protein [Bacteroides thetaiotaomicron]|uniref:hypothetical protein n=1 Tax=Bacteroides thetaiotaomicron TaxID=818 RepID=UPI0039C2C2C9
MKRITFLLNISIIVITVMVLGSCSQEEYLYEDEITPNEKLLNLQAPSGEYLAENINALKERLAFIIEEGHEESKDFEIVSIEYDTLSVGFNADIEYRTKDGIESNVIISNKGSISVPTVKTRGENSSSGTDDSDNSETIVYKCKKAANNKCKACRLVQYDGGRQKHCWCDNGRSEGCELYQYKYRE